MKSFAASLAALHGGLWQVDPWYSRAWLAGPLALALLVAGSLWIGPATPGAAPWWKPDTAAPLPKPEPQNKAPASEAVQRCNNNAVDYSTGVAACTQALAEDLAAEPRADILTRRGYLYGRLKQPSLQIADYDQALRIFPNSYWALSNRGSYKLTQNDVEGALVDLNKSLGISQNYAAAWTNRADVYYRQKKYNEALSDLNNAIRLDGTVRYAYWKRGRTHQELGLHDAAIRDFTEYLKRDPNDPEALRTRAVSYFATRRINEAFADLNEALRINPKDAAALASRAYGNYLNQKYGQAIADATEALQNDLNYLYANQIRGRAKVALGQYASALPDLNVAIRNNPLADLYIDRGKALANTGAYDAALRDYREAARIEPRSATAQYWLGVTTERQENERVRRCRAGLPALDMSREPIGGSCIKEPNYSEALDYYSKAIELNGNYAAPRFDRGRIFLATAQIERAKADVDAGLALDSRDINGYLVRGLVLAARERWNDALDDFSTAIRLNPQSAVAYYNRGNVYIRINDRPRAISDLRAAVELDSNYEDAKRLLRALGQKV